MKKIIAAFVVAISTSIAGFGLAEDATKSEPKKQESFPAGNDMPVTAANANLAMLRGVNFGNVFDQSANEEDGSPAKWGPAWKTLSLETLKKMADLYHAKGVRQFRMPFTWRDCMDAKTGVIDKDHPKFVKYNALLIYILDRYPDTYLVVKTHHDNWYTEWATKKAVFSGLWKDIALFYRDACYRMILELDNEPFHTKGGSSAEVREMMKVGWDAIRGTGGRNQERLVMLTPYGGHFFNLKGTYPDLKAVDTITGGENERVIMTVHYYLPWNYVGYGGRINDKVGYAPEKLEKAVIDLSMWSQKTGIPVNVGELGVAWRYEKRYPDGKLIPEMTDEQVRWYEIVCGACIKNKLSFAVWDDDGWYRVLDRKLLTFHKAIDALQ